MITLNINVSGQLQKAGYAHFIKQRAEKCNIKGTICYSKTGAVIRATGTRHNLDEFLEFCRLGTPFSQVIEISLSEIKPEKYTSFNIIESSFNKNTKT